MALMYGWATKEYLFEKMTMGQLYLYCRYGNELKNGVQPEKKEPETMLNKSHAELKKIRDDLIKTYGRN